MPKSKIDFSSKNSKKKKFKIKRKVIIVSVSVLIASFFMCKCSKCNF